MSQSSLFRTEVLQARRQQWLGAVALDQPPTLRWLALLAVLAVAGVGAGLARGEYTRRTVVSGVLVPSLGVATVNAPVAGIVARIGVEEGMRVLAGGALATIAIPGETSRGATAEALAHALAGRRLAIDAAHASRKRRVVADRESMERQHRLALAELDGLDAELVTRRRQLALVEHALSRYRTLQAQRYVTDLQLQQQEMAALDQVAAGQSLERQATTLRRQLQQLEQSLAALPEQLAQADADAARDLALLAQEEAQLQARRDAVVAAPLTGRVATLLVQSGQAVQAGQPLLTLLPAATRLEAHLFVPGTALARVAPGDRVLMRYAAFPFQKYGQHGGRVVRVSGTALPPSTPGAEPLFRIVVAPDRQQVGTQPLLPGQGLDAHVLGDRRRLWEWVFEPLQSLRAAAIAEPVSERGAVVPAITASPAVRDLATGASKDRAGGTADNARIACAVRAIGAPRVASDEASQSRVGNAPMAADPGATGVLHSPALGGQPTGACDA